MHNDFYYELVLCLETLAFKLSAMHKITVHVCTWLNKTSRKGNVSVNTVFLALFFCKTFPGSRCDLLKSLIVTEKVILKVIQINLKYKINHTLLFYFTKQYHGLHGWHSFLEWSVRIVNFDTSVQFSSVFSHVWLFATPRTAACQASLTVTWSLPKLMSIESVCHPTISSSVVPFSSCPQSFPASGSFQMSHLFTSGGQSIGVSVSTSVLFPMNTQDWSPLGWTGWISLQSKGLSRVFANTTVQKHQFFGNKLSL